MGSRYQAEHQQLAEIRSRSLLQRLKAVLMGPTPNHAELMDSRHRQDNTDNRFLFRRVGIYGKRTELCVTTCIRRRTSSHIADAITEWLPLKLGLRYGMDVRQFYSPVIFTTSPLQSE